MGELKRLAFEEVIVANRAASYEKVFNLEYSTGFAIISKAESTTPSPFTFTPSDVPGLSLIIKVGHGCETGLKVRFSSTGVLPGGISAATDYWLIKNTVDILRVANSLENALSGTFITITDGGSGTHTITPSAESAPVITLEASLDNEIFAPISGVNITLGATPYLLESETAYYHYLKVIVSIASGQYNINSKLMSKGQQI
jgi:hypothetical protein